MSCSGDTPFPDPKSCREDAHTGNFPNESHGVNHVTTAEALHLPLTPGRLSGRGNPVHLVVALDGAGNDIDPFCCRVMVTASNEDSMNQCVHCVLTQGR